MPANVRNKWFAQYAAGITPPAGIYHVAGTPDLFYAVDFGGMRSVRLCQLPISYDQAMAMTALNGVTGLGDLAVGGSCIPCTFTFEIPCDVSDSLTACAAALKKPTRFTKREVQLSRHGRKAVYDCWTGAAFATLNRALDRWIKTVIEHPFEDVLFRCTCRQWQHVEPLRTTVAIKKCAGLTLSAILRLDADWPLCRTICGYTLTVGNQRILVNYGRVYKVNNVVYARVFFDARVLSTMLKWAPCLLSSPDAYVCEVGGVEALNNRFTQKLIQHRVVVLKHGKLHLHLHSSKFKVASILARAFWGAFIVSQRKVPNAVCRFAPRRCVGDSEQQTRNSNGTSIPKCLLLASAAKDGKLQNGLRLDVSALIKAVYNRTGRNIATDFFFRQLLRVGKFNQDRIKTLKQVITRDISNSTKDVGVASCRRRQTNQRGTKLACPYTADDDAMAQCAADCGHLHLSRNDMIGFNPADMVVGAKISKRLIVKFNTGTMPLHPFTALSN